MKKIKIFIIFFVLVIITAITIFFLNNKNEKDLIFDEKIISGTISFEESITNQTIDNTYFYSDSYFKDSGELENEHLRTFAFLLTMAFNPTYKESSVNYNIDKLLSELNFKDKKYYDLNEFNKNTIGTTISHKKLNEKYELVTVVLRGADYKDEWISNFDIGASGNVKGFDDASQIVLSRLYDYLKENNINKYKLLVTGYSRSAAIASLVGIHINNNLNKYNINKNDIFVYAYEPPKYSANSKIYENIHNIVNKNDIITYFYPQSLGIYHSGVIEDITTEKTTLNEKYLSIMSNEKIKNIATIDKQDFISEFINFLPKNRDEFYKVSDNISNLYILFNSKSKSEKEKIFDFLKNIQLDTNLNTLYNINTFINSSKKEEIKKIFDKFTSSYDNSYNKISNVLSKNEYQALKEDILNIYLFLQPSIKSDYNNNYMFYHILTFTSNLEEIFKEHYFSVNLKEIIKKDSYYTN